MLTESLPISMHELDTSGEDGPAKADRTICHGMKIAVVAFTIIGSAVFRMEAIAAFHDSCVAYANSDSKENYYSIHSCTNAPP